jgi:GT2 family glycosyltransferase
MSSRSIDIAIVNYRGAADTIAALKRLEPWSLGTVWLVDNSAHEPDMAAETGALIEASAQRPWVTHLAPDHNLGFGRACNLAFSGSTSTYFLLLNPDARITTEDTLLLAQTMAERPALGAVSPRIYWNDSRSFLLPTASAQTPLHSLGSALASWSPRAAQWAALRGIKQSMRQMSSASVFKVGFLAGAVMMLRRTAVLSVNGLFDPDYFMFYEDSDLSLRLRRAGHQLAMVPQASAVHEYRHKAYKAAMMARSRLQYFEKQYPGFYRRTEQLSRLDRLPKPFIADQWFKVLPRPVESLADFTALTEEGRVVAFSPSLLMMPALVRPSMAEARCFDALEWALLEPATYAALMERASDGEQEWICFERI